MTQHIFYIFGPTLYNHFDHHNLSSVSFSSCCSASRLRLDLWTLVEDSFFLPGPGSPSRCCSRLRLGFTPGLHKRRSPTPQSGALWRLHRRARPGRPGLGPPPSRDGSRSPRGGTLGFGWLPAIESPPSRAPPRRTSSLWTDLQKEKSIQHLSVLFPAYYAGPLNWMLPYRRST